MENLENKIYIEGPPYLIGELNPNKYFKVDYIIQKNITKDFCTLYSNNQETLELGMDIQEIPNRGLSLLIRAHKNDLSIHAIINEIRKLSAIAGVDYFSYEEIICGKNLRFLLNEGNINLFEVKPRLFRKIINN